MGKAVLISGGTKGIGLAVVDALHAAGHRVATFCPFADEREAFTAQYQSACQAGMIACFDGTVSDEKSVASVVERTVQAFGQIDVLINNAGVAYYEEAQQASLDQVRAMFEVNVFGAMALTKAVLPLMRAAKSGQIIATLSTSSRHVSPRGSLYGASKHALLGYLQGLRAEVRESGIKVAAVIPGLTRTGILAANELTRRPQGEQQMLEPSEVARAFMFIIDQPATSDIREVVLTPAGSTRYHF